MKQVAGDYKGQTNSGPGEGTLQRGRSTISTIDAARFLFRIVASYASQN
jgi:hypothetical protein